MASATAKLETSTSSTSQAPTGDEDIAAIAKQISDHAEAIYQTWKSRGLAPTEILNCHSSLSAHDKFGPALTPHRPSSVDQFLAVQDNNNLERFVQNFVVEDKARLAAAGQRSPTAAKTLPSSIQFARQKFEKNNVESPKSPITPEAKSGWPLKNKLVTSSSVQIKTNYMDEIAREEERLINALKAGVALDHEDSMEQFKKQQKPAILHEKPKVEVVKPILVTSNHIGPISPTLVNNVAKVLSPTSNGGRSTMDFAKARFGQKIQEEKIMINNNSCSNDSNNHVDGESPALVLTTRSKFESLVSVEDESPKLKEKVVVKGVEKDFNVASRWGLRLSSPKERPRHDQQVPHPELTTQQKQHIRLVAATGTGNNPVRPFLTRGSVAERVLIFEKCPSELLLDKRGPRQPAPSNNWRANQEKNKFPLTQSKDSLQPKSLPPHTTLQRHVKANKNIHIPRFYFPAGKPPIVSQLEATISRITSSFQSLPGHRASRSQFHTITKACDLPLYWKIPLFLASGGETKEYVEQNEFIEYWKELCSTNHDAASKFVRIVTKDQYILPMDLIPLVQDVVETHPGLTFLKEATEFHSRYVHTVIARIFYYVNRSWSGKISLPELRRSNLLSVIAVLEHEEDINKVTAYFSYEHFYVIYCKFWELDRDHDLMIDKKDLMRYNDFALSTRIVERIFSGAVTRHPKGGASNGTDRDEEKMSYTEFVWFLLSEGDKNHPTAIEYWFRCMDLDGDGYLSMYELEYFYEEQLHRIEEFGIETLPFEDCLCQMLDMIRPKIVGKISLSDMKNCKMTSVFFDTFFNLAKFLDHEQRDPFASRNHGLDGEEMSDWDRFAAEEYELLVAEESGNDPNDQSLYDSDGENEYSPNLESLVGESVDTAQNATDIIGAKGHTRDESSSRLINSPYESCDSDDYADSDN